MSSDDCWKSENWRPNIIIKILKNYGNLQPFHHLLVKLVVILTKTTAYDWEVSAKKK